ncbi:MAG: 1-deoxy-D-xylulose-5-phosphate reductoisomerase [Deltaproteobacteria bacterium]|nr:1-deoxy-D-xylulose-5-phosphate reductoisomerase [Deltaproteobacteria bacterium]
MKPKKVSVLGSTGSIGTSTLEVLRMEPKSFQVESLVAGDNLELLVNQIAEFNPQAVAIRDPDRVGELTELLKSRNLPLPQIGAGAVEIEALAGGDASHIVVAAMVGMVGLRGVLAALHAGKRVALANKESLVAGGKLVEGALKEGKGELIPVDSEHSAIFQVLQGERMVNLSGITLTASGGPFLSRSRQQLKSIRPEDAVKHPRWRMGAKISVDSATMFNKGLELIEAHWLFSLGSDAIEVVIHPQSIVHSLIKLTDGSQFAQLSLPDMKGPIAYALTYPDSRLSAIMPPMDLCALGSLTFIPLDPLRFPAIAMARSALTSGGAAPAVLNLANELAVSYFFQGSLTFDQIDAFVAAALEEFGTLNYASIEELEQIEAQLRRELQPGFIAKD